MGTTNHECAVVITVVSPIVAKSRTKEDHMMMSVFLIDMIVAYILIEAAHYIQRRLTD